MKKIYLGKDTHLILQKVKYVILFLFFFGAFVVVNVMEIKSRSTEINNDIIRMMSAVNSEVGIIINSRVLLVRGVIALIADDPEKSKGKFQKGSSFLIGDDPFIRNLTLIEGAVVTEVYPLKGNESVLGTDLSTIPGQRDTFLAARSSRTIVVSGPLDLVQGGKGLIFRLPIIIEEEYWGQASMVINMDRILEELAAKFERSRIPVNYAVRGVDGKGGRGDFFVGNPSDVGNDAESIAIAIPGGEWELMVSPKPGWFLHERIFMVYWLISILLLALIYWTLSALRYAEIRVRKMAYHDSLTGLLNRQILPQTFNYLTEMSKRNQLQLGILLLDLDGFKGINDSYGHETGDLYLIKLAEALQKNLRAKDLIFRLGGDEFLILLTDLDSRVDGDRVVAKIRALLEKPHSIDKYQLPFNFSAGLSIYPEEGADLETLTGLSDGRMYENKKERKSRLS